ncbi:response regulator [bacterium]|nr:response regulator [bacterium]
MDKQLENMLIYIVDDDPINLRLIKAILNQNGFYNLTLLNNGNELLASMEKNKPDILLLDIMMPELSGYDILEILKQRNVWKHIPVIVITALPLADEMKPLKKSFNLGAMDYISKPFNHIELMLRVKSALKLEWQRQQLEDSLDRIRNLEKMISICSYCKKVRVDNTQWQDLEVYISEHSDTQFSHSICPSCYENVVKPEMEEDEKETKS